MKINWKTFFLFSTFDIVISGFLLAIFSALTFILKVHLPSRFNVAFEIPFYLFLGIILGTFKGAVVAFIFDIMNALIKGQIHLWAYEYGIIPPLIAIIASGFLFLLNSKRDIWILLPTVLAFIVASVVLIYYLKMPDSEIQRTSKSWKGIFNKQLIIGLLAVIYSFAFFVGGTLLFLYHKTHNRKWRLAFVVFVILVFIFVVFRYFWHPIAFVRYYNRFLNRTGKDRYISQYFFFYLTPIILKSTITLPVYTFCLVTLTPLVLDLNKKHNFKSRLGWMK
ncbi:ECF transporter S component [Mesomycoplasma hyorhinis]|uniref:ECF transporter S component n=1 Tax=Mesomycoplasma hyorhinis TaxID=2100 RepID=UPI001C042745|nr:ECF transporter S component [Mesomycoplasma hyorhinis]